MPARSRCSRSSTSTRATIPPIRWPRRSGCSRWPRAPASRGIPHGIVAFADPLRPSTSGSLLAPACPPSEPARHPADPERAPRPALRLCRPALHARAGLAARIQAPAQARAVLRPADLPAADAGGRRARPRERRDRHSSSTTRHVRGPLHASPAGAPGATACAMLAACPNVSVKISGLGTLDHHWTVESFRPYVLETSTRSASSVRCSLRTSRSTASTGPTRRFGTPSPPPSRRHEEREGGPVPRQRPANLPHLTSHPAPGGSRRLKPSKTRMDDEAATLRPAGQERPGMLDGEGRIRDLSGKIDDIDGDKLSPAKLKELAAIDPETLPVVEGNPRLGPAGGEYRQVHRHRPQLLRPCRGIRPADAAGAGRLHQGDQLHRRPQRQRRSSRAARRRPTGKSSLAS